MKKFLCEYKLMCFSSALALAVILTVIKVYAANDSYSPAAVLYEKTDSFSSTSGRTETFSCGIQAGCLSLKGFIQHQGEYYGTTAYAATEVINIAYDYAGMYQSGDPDKWNIVDSDEKNLDGTKLPKKVEMGTIVIQRSYDGRNWENACDPICNCFDPKNDKIDLSCLYSIDANDIKKGCYYRILVLYEMKKRTGTESGWFGSEKDVYVNKFFVEKYDFYVCYGANPVQVYNVMNRSISVPDKGAVVGGFIIDTNDVNVSLTVTRDSFSPVSAINYQSFYSPGKYSIVSTNPIGDTFTTEVTVTGGLETSAVSVTRYVNKDKDGYVVGAASGGTPLSSLLIAQNSGAAIKTSTVNSYNGYGITGDSVNLFLRLDEESLNSSGWYLENDDWGKKEKETVDGVWVGQILSGALIVQKSGDGSNWENIDAARYSNGIYTTDFFKNYNGVGDILIYSPDGTDVINGVYLRVLFAYEIANESGKEDKRVIEEYKFYLCCNELDAVTIHNLTASDTVAQAIGDADATTQEIYRRAETMTSGSVTVSGFRIDTSLNPTVTCTVSRNGTPLTIPNNATFTDTGKYEIRLTSAVGSNKTITIYVDRMTIQQTMDLYFGDGFIDGKRIYAEGYYPTYEAGFTSYHIEAVSDIYQPLYGTITNLTTQRTVTINAYRNEKSGELMEPGEYEVRFSNNPTFNTESPSGDNKIITFHFTIIPEGSAPGPVVNRNNLENRIGDSASGLYPKYYGLTYPSLSSGYITLAFATREAAFQYAYNYERGTVEKLPDGSYRYIGSFIISEKENYDSAWDLTDALNYYAEMAIHELYFDISDQTTYLTLQDSVINSVDNLRGLDLRRSVVLFGDDQKEKLTDLNAIPIINDVPYAYLLAGDEGQIDSGLSEFMFIKDKYGCDSDSVVIIDELGREYSIKYNESVGRQLQQMECPTGLLTIRESTIYGDAVEYQAVYFAEGENTATILLNCYLDGEKTNISLSQADEGELIDVGAFSIQQLTDELDPYDLILVSDDHGNTSSFVAGSTLNGAWSDVGEYSVSVINRIGNKYSFNICITDSHYATINFQGMGTETFEAIVIEKGAGVIELPIPEWEGYVFEGYLDEYGNRYDSNISQVNFNGTRTLTAMWKPKTVTITFLDTDGNYLGSQEADYRSYFTIPDTITREGYRVVAWSYNGFVVEDNTIYIQTESPITLIATLAIDESYVPDGQDNVARKLPTSIFVLLIIVVGASIGYFVKTHKSLDLKHKSTNDVEMSLMDNGQEIDDKRNVFEDKQEISDEVLNNSSNENADFSNDK